MGDQASGGKGKLSQLSIFEAKKGEVILHFPPPLSSSSPSPLLVQTNWVVQEEATNKKAASASGAGGTRFVPPEGDRCDVCGKRVYVAEKLEVFGHISFYDIPHLLLVGAHQSHIIAAGGGSRLMGGYSIRAASAARIATIP